MLVGLGSLLCHADHELYELVHVDLWTDKAPRDGAAVLPAARRTLDTTTGLMGRCLDIGQLDCCGELLVQRCGLVWQLGPQVTRKTRTLATRRWTTTVIYAVTGT
jgi:hypothetical protein